MYCQNTRTIHIDLLNYLFSALERGSRCYEEIKSPSQCVLTWFAPSHFAIFIATLHPQQDENSVFVFVKSSQAFVFSSIVYCCPHWCDGGVPVSPSPTSSSSYSSGCLCSEHRHHYQCCGEERWLTLDSYFYCIIEKIKSYTQKNIIIIVHI